jgi:hypothetical protein
VESIHFDGRLGSVLHFRPQLVKALTLRAAVSATLQALSLGAAVKTLSN